VERRPEPGEDRKFTVHLPLHTTEFAPLFSLPKDERSKLMYCLLQDEDRLPPDHRSGVYRKTMA
jgi:hypothetical protein